MLKNSILWFCFLSVSLILFISSSCKKQEDAVDPIITYTSPAENQIFNVFDTIHITATVTSEDQLTGLQISLADENLVPVLPTYTLSLNSIQPKTWEIDQYIPIDAIQLQSGNYFLWIRATTAYTTKNKYLSIRLIEVKKSLKRILLLVRSNVNTTSLYTLDSFLQLEHRFDFAQDLSTAVVDPLNSLLYVAGRNTGTLTAFELDSNHIRWQKSGAGTPELPYYQDIRLEGNMLLVSSSDGRLTGYDPSGSIDFYKDFGFIQYPLRNCIQKNVMVTAVEQKNGSLRYINNYYYPSGAYQTGLQLPFKVVSILPIIQDQMLVTGNQAGSGILKYYFPKEPGLYTPCVFPDLSIQKVVSGPSGNFFIMTGATVFWFQVSGNTLTSFINATSFTDINYDVVTGRVIAAKHNTLSFYSFPQASLINTVTVPDTLKACLMWYNK